MDSYWPKKISVAGGFRVFKVSPEAFYSNKPISFGKCEHKLAYNVSGFILSVPTKQRQSIF
jgi:hypothetical protein